MPLPTLPSAIDLSPFCSEIHLRNLSPTAPGTSLPFAKKLPWVCGDLYEWLLVIPHEEPASSWRMLMRYTRFFLIAILLIINFSRTRFLYSFNERLFYATSVIFRKILIMTEQLLEINADPILMLLLRFIVICKIHKISLLLGRN